LSSAHPCCAGKVADRLRRRSIRRPRVDFPLFSVQQSGMPHTALWNWQACPLSGEHACQNPESHSRVCLQELLTKQGLCWCCFHRADIPCTNGCRRNSGLLIINGDEAPWRRNASTMRQQVPHEAPGDSLLKEGQLLPQRKEVTLNTMSAMIFNSKYESCYAGDNVKSGICLPSCRRSCPLRIGSCSRAKQGDRPDHCERGAFGSGGKVPSEGSSDAKARQGICNHAKLLISNSHAAHHAAGILRTGGSKNSTRGCS
jgi:hypothetical protein